MNQAKYIGMDVHQATISVAVMDSAGKLILESILETKAATILQFIGGLRGSLLVTFEEGTSAAWLYDLLKPRVANVLVCDPRKNALLKDGSKSDRIDARKGIKSDLWRHRQSDSQLALFQGTVSVQRIDHDRAALPARRVRVSGRSQRAGHPR